MQGNIALKATCAVSDTGFSLDELVVKVEEVMEKEGLSGMVAVILELVQESLIVAVMKGRDKAPAYLDPCCKSPYYQMASGRQSKRGIRTSLGAVAVTWRRVRCRNCKSVMVPLREFLGLERWQSRSRELEKVVVETVAEQSYRRSTTHLETIGLIPVPKSTAHRWVVDSDCDTIDAGDECVEFLFADGTGFKRRPDKEKGISNRGELRFILGVTLKGKAVPFGVWSEESWDAIGESISPRSDPAPVGEFLLSDGEQGIVDGLSHLTWEQQRCHWHVVRGLYYPLREDGASSTERKESSKNLAELIRIEIPDQDYDKIPDEDLAAMKTQKNKIEHELTTMISGMFEKGYGQAATYLLNAKGQMFRYLDYWLKYGISCPKTINLIERMMREIGRRLKKIAFGWSDEGAAKMARIIVKRLKSPEAWNAYWKKKMNIQGNVQFILRGIESY